MEGSHLREMVKWLPSISWFAFPGSHLREMASFHFLVSISTQRRSRDGSGMKAVKSENSTLEESSRILQVITEAKKILEGHLFWEVSCRTYMASWWS